MATNGIQRIAELANVTKGTVDRALHGRPGISVATRKKILRIAKRLAYTPHPAARVLSIGRASLRIGICIPEELHLFYDPMRAGIFDEARRLRGLGVEIVYLPVPLFGAGEKERVIELLDRGVNALAVTPGNPKSVRPAIERAEKKNVRVICLTTDAPQSGRSGVVCVDPKLSGHLAAELMAKFVRPGAKAALITGMHTAEEHRLKTEAFCERFPTECAGGKIAAVLEAHESEEESYRKTSELLAEHPDLGGIYVSTVNCLPVCRALSAHKRAGKVQLITTDLFPEMVPHFNRKTIQASIYQDPYLQGQTAVRLLADFLLNGIAIPSSSYLNPGIALRSNLLLFREVQRNGGAERPAHAAAH
jgi:LacI family transcriptional regulator